MRTDLHEPVRVLVFYHRPEEFLPELCARFPDVRFFTSVTYDALEHDLARVRPHVVLAYKFEPKPFPRQQFLSCSSLRWLSVGFAGVDHLAPWDESKIIVTNAAGVASTEMAQYALAAIFGLFQGFPRFFREQATKRWNYRLIRSARGATVGLVGLGHAGTAIARMCQAVGLRVHACRARPQPSPYVEKMYGFGELHDMLGAVDVTVVCTALTPHTRDLFGHDAFAAMKPGSYFINMSRGAVVREEALVAALHGHLGGAVIDVARTEPLPPDSPLWDAPNLFITPHTSSEYAGWFRDAAMLFADNLERWLVGAPLENKTSSDRGY